MLLSLQFCTRITLLSELRKLGLPAQGHKTGALAGTGTAPREVGAPGLRRTQPCVAPLGEGRGAAGGRPRTQAPSLHVESGDMKGLAPGQGQGTGTPKQSRRVRKAEEGGGYSQWGKARFKALFWKDPGKI